MIGKRVPRDTFQPQACSGKKIPKNGLVYGNGNVVFIDIDSDKVDDVIIIDGPGLSQQNSHNSGFLKKNKKCPSQGVIKIDDEDDVSDDMDHAGIVAEGGEELDSDASSSKKYSPFSDSKRKSVDVDGDDCWVVQEKKSTFKFSKCRSTYFAETSSKDCHGLDRELESEPSKSIYSDCEVMEGSAERVREQWEKASLSRKRRSCEGYYCFDQKACPSGSHSDDVHDHTEVESRRVNNTGSPVCSSTSKLDHFMKEKLFSFFAGGNSQIDIEGIYGNNSDTHIYPEIYAYFKPGFVEKEYSLDKNSDFPHQGGTSQEDSPCLFRSKGNISISGVSGSSMSTQEAGDERSEPLTTHSKQKQRESDVNNNRYFSREKDHISSQTNPDCNMSEERHAFSDVNLSKSRSPFDRQVNFMVSSEEKVGSGLEDIFSCSTPSPGISEVCNERSTSQAKPVVDSTLHERQSMLGSSCLSETTEPSDTRDRLRVQDDVTPTCEMYKINDRERLKETDEYKRAQEEEWASRQRELQIQAEEAQRLRKKRKAETLRLLDMQRRQQQRVEEVRETQKKDQENMNLKEHLRNETRKELTKLEMTCIDMASLLRCLGIQVAGGFTPSVLEVRAAYKRALLKFHPDRASQTDIQQQVEAEEKFKLISRMKEKFLLT